MFQFLHMLLGTPVEHAAEPNGDDGSGGSPLAPHYPASLIVDRNDDGPSDPVGTIQITTASQLDLANLALHRCTIELWFR